MRLDNLDFFAYKERLTADDYVAILESVGDLCETMIIKIDKSNPQGKYAVSLPYTFVEGGNLKETVQTALKLFID
jgi:hypothetical protein